MTKKDYAARRGCSPAYLSKKETAARLAPAMVRGENGAWMIDSDIADKIFKDTADPARKIGKAGGAKTAAGGSAAPEAGTYENVRTESALVKLEHERLDLAARKGQTVPRHSVYEAAAGAGQAIREYLRGRNQRIAEQASTMTDARQIRAMLEESDRVMLQMISDDFMRRIPAAEAGGAQATTH